ncbi:general transcription factor II-I repeat domain-containing protein 2A-like [Aphis gossypii]|uniref:general transcription factor II-I repeat domain-containing protein 2A-like n=1 Tax=Aphis gossypii TaxID=80765 RepID=UPI0021597FF5|nr:general transcription factor II-I repeat domain-containing protein 2A-like [Aphis gossypii]
MSNDITDQLQTDLASENYFSICLDESTDVTSQTRLAVFVRFSSVNIMREELIKLMTISTKTTGQDIMNVVLKEFANLKININNIVSINKDGAPNMVGKHNGFVQLFSNEISHPLISFHCLIHQEALCAKDSLKSLQNVMEVVTKVVNFITSRALNNRQFTKLLDEVESQYAGLLMYNSVRWLSRGQVLHRFVALLEEIRLFLFEKSQDYPELKDLNWLNDLMLFTDFTTMYNELNKKLQGPGQIVLTMFENIKDSQTDIKCMNVKKSCL